VALWTWEWEGLHLHVKQAEDSELRRDQASSWEEGAAVSFYQLILKLPLEELGSRSRHLCIADSDRAAAAAMACSASAVWFVRPHMRQRQARP
jgi:hypothetical protein